MSSSEIVKTNVENCIYNIITGNPEKILKDYFSLKQKKYSINIKSIRSTLNKENNTNVEISSIIKNKSKEIKFNKLKYSENNFEEFLKPYLNNISNKENKNYDDFFLLNEENYIEKKSENNILINDEFNLINSENCNSISIISEKKDSDLLKIETPIHNHVKKRVLQKNTLNKSSLDENNLSFKNSSSIISCVSENSELINEQFIPNTQIDLKLSKILNKSNYEFSSEIEHFEEYQIKSLSIKDKLKIEVNENITIIKNKYNLLDGEILLDLELFKPNLKY